MKKLLHTHIKMFQYVSHLALKQSFVRHIQYLQGIIINLKDDRTKTIILYD